MFFFFFPPETQMKKKKKLLFNHIESVRGGKKIELSQFSWIIELKKKKNKPKENMTVPTTQGHRHHSTSTDKNPSFVASLLTTNVIYENN
jgi:hypothetical protein